MMNFWHRIRQINMSGYFKYFRIVCIINVLLYILLSIVQLMKPQASQVSYFTIEPSAVHHAVSNIPKTFQRLRESRSNISESQNNISESQDAISRSKPVPTHSNRTHRTHKQYRNTSRSLAAFETEITTKEKRLFQDLILKFKAVLEENGIPFIMYSGTLLGSYRHHDIIPWDDDIDIVLSSKYRKQLKSMLTKLRPFFCLNTQQHVRWKFYSTQSRPIGNSTWSWPFLDISFYKENSTHIWDFDHIFGEAYMYLKSDVFPLTKRPFMGMLLPAPRNTSAVLKYYNPDICFSMQYNHQKECLVSFTTQMNCEKLKNRFPFVKRERVENGFNETLIRGGKVLRWFFTKNM